MILGDMGATVWKVEQPRKGDDTRQWGPPFVEGESSYYMSANRNKESVVIDLKQAAGVDLIKQLAAQADVVVENFAGKANKLGIGYESLKECNDKLIYASISGYGQDGPYGNRPAYDVMVAAEGGMLGITGTETEAVKPGVALTDIISGQSAATGILAALYHRAQTGKGQYIETTLLDNQVAALANVGGAYLAAGKEGKRWGTAHGSIVPYRSYGVKGGEMVVGALNNRQFDDLCTALDLHSWREEEGGLDSNEGRVAKRSAVDGKLGEVLSQHDFGHWTGLLTQYGIPHSLVHTLDQVYSHPQIQYREVVQEVAHPKIGKVKMVRSPVRMTGSPTSIRLPPPTLGYHTEVVLRDVLGYDEEGVAKLRQQGVIE